VDLTDLISDAFRLPGGVVAVPDHSGGGEGTLRLVPDGVFEVDGITCAPPWEREGRSGGGGGFYRLKSAHMGGNPFIYKGDMGSDQQVTRP